MDRYIHNTAQSRAPHGARGLKSFPPVEAALARRSRAPHGARGLKYFPWNIDYRGRWSRPTRGAWIEILSE